METKWLATQLLLVLAMAYVLKGSKDITLCNMSEDGLMACKPSVTKPNPTYPTTECCKAVAGADLKCLCSYKNSVELPILGIDPTLAISLPSKCNLTTPVDC